MIITEGPTTLNVELVPIVVPVALNAVNPYDGRLYIQILDVDGITFTEVAMEPRCTPGVFAQHLKKVWTPESGAYLSDPIGTASCVSSQVDPCTATENELTDAFNSCLGVLYGKTYASVWVRLREKPGTIPVAYLAEPTRGLNGITLTWVNKRITRNADLVTFQWILGYEPQFPAPMPAPGFRGRESYSTWWPPIGEPRMVDIKGEYSGGYSYPGMYDGRIMVSYWTYNNPPYPIADFRIKNLARV